MKMVSGSLVILIVCGISLINGDSQRTEPYRPLSTSDIIKQQEKQQNEVKKDENELEASRLHLLNDEHQRITDLVTKQRITGLVTKQRITGLVTKQRESNQEPMRSQLKNTDFMGEIEESDSFPRSLNNIHRLDNDTLELEDPISNNQPSRWQEQYSRSHDQAQRSHDAAEPERQKSDVLHNEVLYDNGRVDNGKRLEEVKRKQNENVGDNLEENKRRQEKTLEEDRKKDAHLLGSPTYQFFLIAILAFCGVGVFMAVSVAIIYLVRKIKHDNRRRNTIELENNAELGMYYYQCSDYSSDNCSTYTSHSQLSEEGYGGGQHGQGLFSDDDSIPRVGVGSHVQPPQQCLVYNRLSSNQSSCAGGTLENSAAPFTMANHSRVYDSTTCLPPYDSTTCHPQPTDPLRYGTFHGVDNQCFTNSDEPHSEVHAPMDTHGLLKTKKKDKKPVSK